MKTKALSASAILLAVIIVMGAIPSSIQFRNI